ncbi:N-acetyltransferase [Lentibacillus saliphilus]|uniref:N-acetyltransferase n=1 Tax=Lentibacillus saliphilus TaxID=2737028 RepID=UPI001C3062BF
MKIRKYDKTDVNQIIDIWYTASILAHDFIHKDYWEKQRTAMRDTYLPMSETYVITNKKGVIGFVSMVDHYLAALFIEVAHQGEGYGRELLDYIKARTDHIQLKVYKRNQRAVNFYERHGFSIKEALIDDQTGEAEFLMEWRKD